MALGVYDTVMIFKNEPGLKLQTVEAASFIKNAFLVFGMWHAAYSIGGMQHKALVECSILHTALAACIICKCLHTTE
jgi:hypothetical protein